MQLKITEGYNHFYTPKKTILTIGTFDGVHIGHQKIIEQLVSASKEKNETSVLLTFFPHPRMVLQKDTSIKLINTIEEKSKLLQQFGLDELIIHPFSKEFSRLSAFEFVRDILVKQLNISKLIIGYDHHFGKNREGNFEQLEEYGNMFDFELEEISAQTLNDISVSSTKIRNALINGDIEKANDYLGYQFNITGTVVEGNNIGTKIGYPTANIKVLESYKLIPKSGAYVIKSTIKGIEYLGMLNIGNRPTINGIDETIEAHFFDFSGNLYEEQLEITFLKFIRNEHKFESLEKLTLQLHQDKKYALSFASTIL